MYQRLVGVSNIDKSFLLSWASTIWKWYPSFDHLRSVTATVINVVIDRSRCIFHVFVAFAVDRKKVIDRRIE